MVGMMSIADTNRACKTVLLLPGERHSMRRRRLEPASRLPKFSGRMDAPSTLVPGRYSPYNLSVYNRRASVRDQTSPRV